MTYEAPEAASADLGTVLTLGEGWPTPEGFIDLGPYDPAVYPELDAHLAERDGRDENGYAVLPIVGYIPPSMRYVIKAIP